MRKELLMKSVLGKVIFVLAIAVVFVLVVAKPSDRMVKTVNVDRHEVTGKLYFKGAVKCGAAFDESKIERKSPAFEISDDCFSDSISGIEVKNPVYKLVDGAYFVNTKRKTFIVMNHSEVRDDPNIQLDVSPFKTRRAYGVFDGKTDTGEVVYYQTDALGNIYIYLAHFKNGVTNAVYELSKSPFEWLTPSELGICGSYGTDGFDYAWQFAPKKDKLLNLENGRVDINDETFYFSPHDKAVEEPILYEDTNAVFSQGKKNYAAMYFVGEKWDSKNSVDVTDFDRVKAYYVCDRNGDLTDYKLYIFEKDGEKNVSVACMTSENDLPKYCQYLIGLTRKK